MMMTWLFWPGDRPVRLRKMLVGKVHRGFMDVIQNVEEIAIKIWR
jgi:hypothetical protein